jgi:outer membrane protein assembly factor BamE (lipoprotein component of BamABCDE complex)
MIKAVLLLAVLTGLYSCIPVSPYLLPPGGVKVGFTRTSVEDALGQPTENVRMADKRYYLYKHSQWVGNSRSDIYETLFWVIEFGADDKVTEIATLQGSFFSSTSRRARRWIQERALQSLDNEVKIEAQ